VAKISGEGNFISAQGGYAKRRASGKATSSRTLGAEKPARGAHLSFLQSRSDLMTIAVDFSPRITEAGLPSQSDGWGLVGVRPSSGVASRRIFAFSWTVD
jgi:hypothetical protein